MPKFNLLDEPWIPVFKDGKVTEVGLAAALLEAHTIERIEVASPLEEAALHRLLLAVLYRALPPVQDVYAAMDVLEKGEFDRGAIAAYLDRYHDRFYLFHERHPFWQIADLPQDEALPWSKLLPELSSGNNPTLFDHTTDENPPVASYAQAARALLVHQNFAPGGLLRRLGVGSAKDAPLARPAAFLPVGQNLFQTLVLNLVPDDCREPPIWETPPLTTRDVTGYATKWPLQGSARVFTWPSRGVLLLDSGGGVRWIAYGPGVEPLDVLWRDPMAAYRQDPKGNVLPLRLSTEKSFWRDFGALLPAAGGQWPGSLQWASSITDRGESSYTLRVLGQVSDQAKLLDIRREVYPLPQGLFSAEAQIILQRGLELAENLGKRLGTVSWHVAQAVLGSKEKDQLQNFAASLPLRRLYWSELDLEFPSFLLRLRQGGALGFWREQLRTAAVRAWEETRRFLGTEGRHLKALGAGERAFAGALAVLKEREVNT
ncbi:MAG: CRISPR-associated protein CasA/Cse1 [Thermoanaerobaculum sp.]|nr:MAG: CRISPR-associated protein CasA/Cse1 [Thermoanaerobaculum sp.]GBC78898.1 CRISPR-associated protein CasA/Cse1 [bacterium HR09]